MFNERIFIVIAAISYIAMLKKVFKLVFRNVSNFSVIFLRVQIKPVCLYTCFFTLIWLSVYPSPNFLLFNLVWTFQFKTLLMSNGLLQSFFLFIFIWIFYLFSVLFAILLFRSFLSTFFVSILLFRSFFSIFFYYFHLFFFNPFFLSSFFDTSFSIFFFVLFLSLFICFFDPSISIFF